MTRKLSAMHVALLGATAIALAGLPDVIAAQQATTVAPAANTEPDTGPVANNAGFVFSIDGIAVNADPVVEDRIRRTDIALANADIQVQYDGLTPTPRLNLELAAGSAYGAGATVQMRSETNYPAFIDRAEILIYDMGATGGARLLATVPIRANGTAEFTVPDGAAVVAVHRVYDANGRFDETNPLPLYLADRRNLTANEDGLDNTSERNIRVRGGAVTVSASNVVNGGTLLTLGEEVRAGSNGKLVIERILPPGEYAVDVAVTGPGQNTNLTRQVQVPGAEWFYAGSGELTYSGIGSDAGTETSGRLSFYVDGKTADGLGVTASIDTGNGELDQIFRRLDERDPQDLAERLALDDAYPTFGDDGTLLDNTPTSGRIYLRVEQDNNFAVWGDFQSRLTGSAFLRNERTLYGAQAHLETSQVTSEGEARAALDLYAAQPDQLVGRDSFRGTGGSVYFLSGDNLTAGTATLTVEQRDADTNRVLDRVTLVEGRDYEIDYIQGVVILNRPLDRAASDGLIQNNPGGDVTINLIAQYEFTPTGVAVDGLSYGGRAEAWAGDNLRVGITALQDEAGATDQTSQAIDLRYTFGANSYVQLDVARSDGTGFGSTTSLDGGLSLDTQAAVAGTGEATRLAGQADFADLGLASEGTIGGYFENRTEGFSTLDYQVTAATGDETLAGVYLTTSPRDGLSYGLKADTYENDAGTTRREVAAEADVQINDQLRLAVGLAYLDETTTTTDGTRLDLGGRLTYALSDATDLYVFGQQAVAVDGLEEYNRAGLGLAQDIAGGWTIGAEISDGTGGLGGRLRAEQQRGTSSTYFGYELDPGRALDAGISQADNGGKFVAGGRRDLSSSVSVFGENVYDVFGSERSLTSAYGVDYQANDFLGYTAGFTFGEVLDTTNGDFDRRGLSIGLRYSTETTTGRVLGEVRLDDAGAGSARSDSETYIATVDVAHKIDDASRFLFSLRAAQTDADDPLLDGRYVDTSLGYALRPVVDERFNLLAQIRYLSDDFGQTIDGVAGAGDVQDSTVFSIDGNYDLNEQWTLGAKFGYRATQSGPDEDTLSSNDAWLAVINARYHMVNEWDILLEARQFDAIDADFTETGFLGAVYKQVGYGTQVGVGYNFGSFSDDLTDLTTDDGGAFINIVASF